MRYVGGLCCVKDNIEIYTLLQIYKYLYNNINAIVLPVGQLPENGTRAFMYRQNGNTRIRCSGTGPQHMGL